MKRSIRRSRTFPHPPARVWQAITSSDALAAWLMPNDFEARVGHRFQFRTDPAPGFDGIVHCEILELEEPQRMVWSWRGGPVDTTVTFELRPEADGTRLSFSQEGFEGLHASFVSLILESGFRKMFRHGLPAVLDRLARDEDPRPPSSRSCDEPRGLGHRVETLVARLFARRTG